MFSFLNEKGGLIACRGANFVALLAEDIFSGQSVAFLNAVTAPGLLRCKQVTWFIERRRVGQVPYNDSFNDYEWNSNQNGWLCF
jgi:hypothetical protein